MSNDDRLRDEIADRQLVLSTTPPVTDRSIHTNRCGCDPADDFVCPTHF